MKKRVLLLSPLALALAMGGLVTLPETPLAAQTEQSVWHIGPIMRGKNYSYRMPATMQPTREGASFDFPYPTPRDGHVHYVTTPTGSLADAKRIVMRYRIDAEPGVRFIPEEEPERTATMSLYFQRAGDSWTMRTPRHRWYAPADKVVPLTPGTHTVSIDLDENWLAMNYQNAWDIPQDYQTALARANSIGFVFGSSVLRGHGVYATGPARFTLLDFRVE
ncbi:MAG: hypothetical protein GW855_13690 [Erythrobacter sp.]|nr:hypothetical protein [Erythrobacter sp.]NCQ62913.1 hypothetical protein [Alphaproteobacteria bacterium]